MSSPKKRSTLALGKLSPNKQARTRRPVHLHALVVGDDTTALIYAKYPTRQDAEPYTNMIRSGVVSTEETALKRIGLFMVVSLCANPESDEALVSDRNYNWKGYILTSDDNLIENNFAILRTRLQQLCDVSDRSLPSNHTYMPWA